MLFQQMKKHRLVEEIKLQYCYPRLDVNVTKGLNHLLKSPFCVHPKTGRVCIPISMEQVDAFNPDLVPTVRCAVGVQTSAVALQSKTKDFDLLCITHYPLSLSLQSPFHPSSYSLSSPFVFPFPSASCVLS